MNYRIEAITLPVSDVDRAKAFYEQAGWHLDVDTGTPQPEPGSYRSTNLVVVDIAPAHRELAERGIPVSDIFHFGPEGQTAGVDPKRADFGSYATFADPDGNTWLLQEVPSRATG